MKPALLFLGVVIVCSTFHASAMATPPTPSYAERSFPLSVTKKLAAAITALSLSQSVAYATPTDEYKIDFKTDYLGIALGQDQYKDDSRVVVKGVKADAEAASYKDKIQGTIVVDIGGTNLEGSGLDTAEVAKLVKASPRPLTITFRDPQLFFQQLGSEEFGEVSTSLRPATATRPAEILKVEILERPSGASGPRASPGDVLEVKYVMRLQDGTVVDTSGETSFDNNYFFALGSAPQEPLPLGWDVGLLGMAVGERRVVTTPSSLGYGAKGLPEYRIPANADILYDVTLVSLNGE